jgi:formylglycine-generating enzyme required for sulfatase activity
MSRTPSILLIISGIMIILLILLDIFKISPKPERQPVPTRIPDTAIPTSTQTVNTPIQSVIQGTSTPTTGQTPTHPPIPVSPITPLINTTTVVSARDGATLILIPGGPFPMGVADGDPLLNADEQPQHIVMLRDYYIDQNEITNTQFASFVQATGYLTDAEKLGSGSVLPSKKRQWEDTPGANWFQPYGPDTNISGQGFYPVTQISWNDANTYCAWVGRRLPTEAEWEKAARGPDGRRFPWGSSPLAGDLLNSSDVNLPIVWADKTFNDNYRQLAPVGSYPAGMSPYGLLDMAGNVWEWVADWYAATYYATSPDLNPAGPPAGTNRVARGGSWAYVEQGVRSANRDFHPPEFRSDNSGFRCAVSALP